MLLSSNSNEVLLSRKLIISIFTKFLFAMKHWPSISIQISFTLKFVVITLVDYFWFKRQIRKLSFISLCLTLSAAVLSQFEPLSDINRQTIHCNPLLGLLMTIFVVVLLAINEFHLKRSWQNHQKNLIHLSTAMEFWNRQLYFAIFGAVTAAVLSPILSEFEGRRPFMFGFNGLVWWLVGAQAATGIFSAFILIRYSIYEQCLAITILPLFFIVIFTQAFQIVVHWPIIVATIIVTLSSCISLALQLWNAYNQY